MVRVKVIRGTNFGAGRCYQGGQVLEMSEAEARFWKGKGRVEVLDDVEEAPEVGPLRTADVDFVTRDPLPKGKRRKFHKGEG